MMSALSEQGSYEEQQQRLYQLASSMGLPGHGQSAHSVFPCVSHRVSPVAALRSITFAMIYQDFTFRTVFPLFKSKSTPRRSRCALAKVFFIIILKLTFELVSRNLEIYFKLKRLFFGSTSPAPLLSPVTKSPRCSRASVTPECSALFRVPC